MTRFEWAHAFTAKWEGGYTAHPADRGGPTAYGVSQAFYGDLLANATGRAFLKARGLPLDTGHMASLTRADAAGIFEFWFWQRTKIGLLPRKLSLVAYDAAVNHGPGRGIRFIQQAAKNSGAVGLAVDGVLGPATLEACHASRDHELSVRALDLRRLFYSQIVARDPSQKVFHKGWLNRVGDLERYLA